MGLNKYMSVKVWNHLHRQLDSKLVKGLASFYWTRNELKNRCFKEEKVTVNRENRIRLEQDRYDLVIGIINLFLETKNIEKL